MLEVLASLGRAGAERVAVSLATGLDRRRFEVEVAALYDPRADGFEPVLAERGVRTHHLGKRRGLDLRMVPRLIGVMRGFAPAIVHTHSYVLRYAWPANAAAGGGPIVHTVHNLARREVDRVGRLLQRAAFRRGVRAVAVGREVARSIREYYGIEPAAVIPNGVELESFRAAPPGAEWKRAHGFQEADRLVISVARLDPQKNPLGLIEAFAKGLAGDPAWHLLLVGQGRLEAAAAGQAERLGIARRVHFLGRRSDVPELLAAGDLFALAADWEGLPVAVIEAMAAGLPVAATAVGGVGELVEEGITGYLAPAGDMAALGDRLAALARDPGGRAELGRCGRERAGRYGLDRMVQSYAALFERVAGGEGSA